LQGDCHIEMVVMHSKDTKLVSAVEVDRGVRRDRAVCVHPYSARAVHSGSSVKQKYKGKLHRKKRGEEIGIPKKGKKEQ